MKWLAGLLAMVLIGGAAGFGASYYREDRNEATDIEVDVPEVPVGTATATIKDLVETQELTGTLGFGDDRPFPTNSTGIVTWLPEEGALIEPGQRLFEIDAHPVYLLEGSLPAHRDLGLVRRTVTSNGAGGVIETSEELDTIPDGADIEQLEAILGAAGFADEYDLTIDEQFTFSTEQAVKEWQASLGLDDTGVVELGTVAFSPESIRVASLNARLGQQVTPAIAVLNVTATSSQVFVDLDTRDTDLVAAGDAVQVELPDERTVDAVVRSISDVATSSDLPGRDADAEPTLEMIVDITESGGGGFDQAPVNVLITKPIATDVLTVPVPALLALSEGGYAVEVRDGDDTRLVGVEVGEFVDTDVEISGDIDDGDQVVIPR